MHTKLLLKLGSWVLLVSTGLAFYGSPARAQQKTPVENVLVFALDASTSMNEGLWHLQVRGYVEALRSASVVQALSAGGGTAVALLQWSGPEIREPNSSYPYYLPDMVNNRMHRVVVRWHHIHDGETAAVFANKVQAMPRLFASQTHIGHAIEFATAVIEKSPYEPVRKILDISGDGIDNYGPDGGRTLVRARQAALSKDIVINAITIRNPTPFYAPHTHPPGGLRSWYERHVIGGYGSFALGADSFEEFAPILRQKIIREVASK